MILQARKRILSASVVASRKYNQKHPGRSVEWRRKKREAKGKPVLPPGRPKKKTPNFYKRMFQQNKNFIEKNNIDFELLEEKNAEYDFKLRQSSIHDIGVTTLNVIPAHTFLMEYHGEMISRGVADEREATYKANGIHIFLMETVNGDVIDATMKGNVSRFINHSSTPNCITESSQDGRGINIMTMRKLKAHEEITIDYHLEAGDAMECNYKRA